MNGTDGKYLVLPSGELHIRDVGPEDGYKTYQCRTKHRLTGETRLSATKGRLVITGKWEQSSLEILEMIEITILISPIILSFSFSFFFFLNIVDKQQSFKNIIYLEARRDIF